MAARLSVVCTRSIIRLNSTTVDNSKAEASSVKEEADKEEAEVGAEKSVADEIDESEYEHVNKDTGERGGPRGPEPTRFGDWERKGRVTDF